MKKSKWRQRKVSRHPSQSQQLGIKFLKEGSAPHRELPPEKKEMGVRSQRLPLAAAIVSAHHSWPANKWVIWRQHKLSQFTLSALGSAFTVGHGTARHGTARHVTCPMTKRTCFLFTQAASLCRETTPPFDCSFVCSRSFVPWLCLSVLF